jgi:hypothetical protein
LRLKRKKQGDKEQPEKSASAKLSEIVMLEFVKDEQSIWWGRF